MVVETLRRHEALLQIKARLYRRLYMVAVIHIRPDISHRCKEDGGQSPKQTTFLLDGSQGLE